MVYTARSRQGGFVIVLLLIVIVAGMLMYFNLAGGHMVAAEKVDRPGEASETGNNPWDFEDCLGTGLNYPLKDGQFHRDDFLQTSYNVKDKATQEKRGNIQLRLEPEGEVFTAWSGTYNKGKDVTYEIYSAGADGNIDPTILYTDVDGNARPDYLYFITKGKFVMLRTEKGRITRPGGELFVTGFIKPNGTFFGTVHLTSDRQSQTVFDFGKEYDE